MNEKTIEEMCETIILQINFGYIRTLEPTKSIVQLRRAVCELMSYVVDTSTALTRNYYIDNWKLVVYYDVFVDEDGKNIAGKAVGMKLEYSPVTIYCM